MFSGSPQNSPLDESAFRIQAPNAIPRSILAVAFDPLSQRLIEELRGKSWHDVEFVNVAAWRAALDARAADVLILVSNAGQPVPAAREIATYAVEHGIKVSAVLLREGAELDAVSRSLQRLRPWTRTLAVLEDAADLKETLHALGG